MKKSRFSEPPNTCMTASVRPSVGRTAPTEGVIQSICAFITSLITPCRRRCEPRRVCRRLISVSYAAMASVSRAA